MDKITFDYLNALPFIENDKLNDNSAIVTTIVSTKMIKAMADYMAVLEARAVMENIDLMV